MKNIYKQLTFKEIKFFLSKFLVGKGYQDRYNRVDSWQMKSLFMEWI